ncbi:MAG: CoA-binding protein, partial [Caldilineales bacterium]|nr:CoA-binding protein [Caldilineales bacterium]
MSSLRPFFNPSGVAIIGASADPHKLSHGILRNAFSRGYRGAVYPVNPKATEILGLRCYPDIEAVPDPVELAVLVVPAGLCPGVLEACGRRGIRAAIVISGGFREVGPKGAALEAELVHIARRHGMRLIGPNCVGTLDAHTGLNTTFIRTMPQPGAIAFVSQSGAICGGILEWTAGKGIGFSRFATLGNAADVTETDLLLDLAEDPNTRVIVAYIEAIRDGRRFIDVARQVTPHKPILVIKAGRTQAGTRAVSSHTGSIAGSMAAYDAAFRQAGVVRVDSVEELFNNALALAYGPLPRGRRVAVVTNAGGPASLAADEVEQVGLAMPPTSAGTRARLAEFAHPEAQLANPVDMLGGAEAPDYERAITALLQDDGFDAVLPILVPQALVDPVAVAEAIGRAAQSQAGEPKPVVACFMGDEIVRASLPVLHRHRV